jgi:very-short-patch-repair endonuclease
MKAGRAISRLFLFEGPHPRFAHLLHCVEKGLHPRVPKSQNSVTAPASLLHEVEKVPKGRKRSFFFPRDGFRQLFRLTYMQTPLPITYTRAKNLRRDMTPAERSLWYNLRDRKLEGHKFVRQVPIGPYIVDFLDRERKLVIELDGATHGDSHEIAHDQKRTSFLIANGYRVHRTQNLEVHENLGEVLQGILRALESSP